jgi:prolyl oligopeptidase
MNRLTIFPALVSAAVLASCTSTSDVPPAAPAAPASPSTAPPVAAGGPPVAKIAEIKETYFGVAVSDPYRWMEDTESAEMKAFLKGQADYTKGAIDALPGRAKLRARLHELSNMGLSVRFVTPSAGRYFYLKTKPGEDNAKLYVREGDKGEERLLVDPDKQSDGKVHYALDWHVPSIDGKLVAYGVSPGGSEDSTLHIIDASTGKILKDAIDRTQYAAVSWKPDNKSFFYWRRPKLGPNAKPDDLYRNTRIYLHTLGQDAEAEKPVFGPGTPGVEMLDTDFSAITVVRGSRWAYAQAFRGVKPEIALYVAPLDQVVPGKTPWRKIIDFPDEVTNFDAKGDDLYLLSHKDASRFKVIKINVAKPDLAKAEVVVPPGERVVTALTVATDGLYVSQRDGGLARLLRVPYGKPPVEVKLPFEGGLGNLASVEDKPGAIFELASWTRSGIVYEVDAKDQLVDTTVAPPSPVDFSNVESVEVKVKSTEGAMVPLSIVLQKGLPKDGSHPLLLIGYGSYGISYDPAFNPLFKAWIEQGGIFATAHVRGGGEYGEDWHQAGKEATKQHTVDDFLACAQYLVDQRYTSPKLLAGQGRSAGGILIGGAITQRPELFRAAVVQVGAVNPLRFETTAGGPANVPEFGTVKTEAGFKGLYAMDPYLHVRDGVAYPAVLFTTGVNDPRVPPWAPAKMAARMQKATTSGHPILLRVDFDAGHGLGSTRAQEEEDYADEWSFLFWQFGLPAFQPAR